MNKISNPPTEYIKGQSLQECQDFLNNLKIGDIIFNSVYESETRLSEYYSILTNKSHNIQDVAIVTFTFEDFGCNGKLYNINDYPSGLPVGIQGNVEAIFDSNIQCIKKLDCHTGNIIEKYPEYFI